MVHLGWLLLTTPLRRGASCSAVLLVSALLASCSSSSGHNASATAAASCAAGGTGVAKSTITVGAIFPTTGPQGAFFEAVGSGIRARFAVANQAGGIGGRQLVLASADDGDGQIENESAARYLVQDKQVFGVIEASTNSDGSAPDLAASGIPVVGWAITPDWGRYPNMFGYGDSTSPLTQGEPVTRAAQFMKAHGATRVAVLAGGAPASVIYAQNFIKTLGPLGVDLAFQDLNVQLGQSDFAFDIKTMKRLGVNALFTGLDTTTDLEVLQAAQQAGLHFAITLLPAGYDARLAAAFPSVLQGSYVEIDWRPFQLPVPADQEFVNALHQVAPSEFPGQLAMVGWLSANLFIEGLDQAGAGCPTRAAFIHNLRMVKGYTAGGLLPPINFSAVFGQEPLCYWEVEFLNGKLVPTGSQPYCGVLLKDYHR